MIFAGYRFKLYSKNKLKSFDIEKSKQDNSPVSDVIDCYMSLICILKGWLAVGIFLTEFDVDLIHIFLKKYYKLDEQEKGMTLE